MTRRLLFLPAVLAAVMVIEPATAATPTYSGCGKFAKDTPTDASDPAGPAPAQVEIEAAWVDAGGAKPSLNIQIADLTGTVPPPATSITYDATYSFGTGTTNFVRAYVDFAGMVAYEYGHTEPLGPSTRYAYDGDIEGEMFTGAHGVVRMVIPPEGGGKPGTVLKAMLAETQFGRATVLPSAVNQSPSRGLSLRTDDASIGSVTIGDCAGAPAGGGSEPGTAPPAAPPASGGGSSSQAEPAPVTLVTKKVKRAKARKAVKVKLRTTEPLTAVGVRLSKGRTVYGTGKLKKLTKTGTVKFKLKKAIKKGTYAFDVAGTDGQGRRRIASLKLKVR